MTTEKEDLTTSFVCESEELIDTVEAAEPETEPEVKTEPTNTIAENDDPQKTKKVEPVGNDTAAEPDKVKKTNRVQKRIDEVVRQREDEKRKNESLTSRIKELEDKKTDSIENAEPIEDNFDTYDEYLTALDVFDKKTDTKTKDEDKDEVSGDSMTSAQKTALAITQERIASAEKPDDFDAVALNPQVPITGEMIEALADCEFPEKIMYHLGQNLSLAAGIASKTLIQQVREIAKLDLTLTSKPKKPTKITNAPEAISPVSGTDSQKKAKSDMSFAEFEQADIAQNKQRHSRW